MIPLIGSPKQIAWADKIRAEYVERMDKSIRWHHEEEGQQHPNHEANVSEEKWYMLTLTIADSEWWIDNRKLLAEGLSYTLPRSMVPKPTTPPIVMDGDVCGRARYYQHDGLWYTVKVSVLHPETDAVLPKEEWIEESEMRFANHKDVFHLRSKEVAT
jgi:hypothetical protein